MPIPDQDVERVRRWVAERNAKLPDEVKAEIRYEVDATPRHLTILECRPPWDPEYGTEWTRRGAARLRYTATRREWSLYWPDHDGDFHLYDLVPPTELVGRLLLEVDRDPTCIFWG